MQKTLQSKKNFAFPYSYFSFPMELQRVGNFLTSGHSLVKPNMSAEEMPFASTKGGYLIIERETS